MAKSGKKKGNGTIRVVVAVCILGVMLVGFYYYLAHKSSAGSEEETKVTKSQQVLMRNLESNYPPSPKEVVKYFAEITKCFYNEEYSEEELEKLATQIQVLYDEALIANKSEDDYMQDLRSEIASMKENKYTIVGYEVSPSTDVEFFTENEESCARLYCNFYVKQGAGNVPSLEQFVLRKDEAGHWKIMGSDLVNK